MPQPTARTRWPSRGYVVELTVVEKEIAASLHQRLEHPAQSLGRGRDVGDGLIDRRHDRAQAVGADDLANGLLRVEELVDVGFGEANGLG